MSYKVDLYKNGLKAIEKIYEKSKYDPDVDLYRSFDIINSLNENQMNSKEWLVDCLEPFLSTIPNLYNIAVLGSWYGLLSAMLRQKVSHDLFITNIDSDPLSKEIGQQLLNNQMYEHNYFVIDDAINHMIEKHNNYRLIINTSCEHMEKEDILYLTQLKSLDTVICFQSNNYFEHASHINTSNSLDEFVESLNLYDVMYKGTLSLDRYERYTVIGK